MNVTNVNDAPEAMSDVIALRAGESLTAFRAQDNDIDVDGDALTITSITQPASGTAVLSNNAISYTPALGSTGTQVIGYTIADPSGLSSSSTITVQLGSPLATDWPTTDGNDEHTRFVPVVLGSGSLTQRWSQPNVGTSAIAGGGLVYVTNTSDSGYKLSAVDLATGGIRWSKATGSYSTSAYLLPSYRDGGLLFAREDTTATMGAYRWDAVSGDSSWFRSFGSSLPSGKQYAQRPVVLGNQVVFSTPYRVSVNALLDGTPGAPWPTNSLGGQTPTVSDGRLFRVYQGRAGEINPATGTVLWDVALPTSNSYAMTPLVSNGVLVAVQNSSLFAVDVDSHTLLWRREMPSTPVVAIAHGSVFTTNGSVTSLDRLHLRTGRLLRNYANVRTGNFCLTSDSIVTAEYSGVKVFDIATGVQRQNLALGTYSYGLCIAGHTIVVSTSSGQVAFGIADPSNAPPAATAQTVSGTEDLDTLITLAGNDPDGSTLTYAVTVLPLRGTLFQQNADGTRGAAITAVPALVTSADHRLIFAPAANDNGSAVATLSFVVGDGQVSSAPATVTLNATPVNDAPVAFDDRYVVLLGKVLTGIRPEANDWDVDGDVLTRTSFTKPTKGVLTAAADGSLTYTPNAGATGTDSFTYTIADAGGLSQGSSVQIELGSALARDWPTAAASPQRDGFVPIVLGSGLFVPAWTSSTGQPRAIITGDGRVISTEQYSLPTTTHVLRALDLGAGGTVWTKSYATANYDSSPKLAPSFSAGRLYLDWKTNGASRIEALMANTGAVDWSLSSDTENAQYFSPNAPIIDGQRGFFSNATSVSGITWTPPAQAFRQSLGDTIYGRAALSNGEVVVTTQNSLLAVNAQSGQQAWSYSVGYTLSPLSSGHGVLAVRSYQDLKVISQASRAQLWTLSNCFYNPAIAHNSVFIVHGGQLKRFHATNGALLKTYALAAGNDLFGEPVVTADSVIAFGANSVNVFDLSTGVVRQKLPEPAGSLYQLMLAGRTLIWTTSNGMTAYRMDDPWNQAPAANAQRAVGTEDAELQITLTGSDPDGDAVWATITSAPTRGTLYQADPTTGAKAEAITTLPARLRHGGGRVFYEPPPDAQGSNVGNFTFTMSDSRAQSAPALVQVDLNGLSDAPLAEPDSFNVTAGQSLASLPVLLNDLDLDGGTLTITSVTNATKGTVQLTAQGELSYTANANVATRSTDTFVYTVKNNSGLTANATVTINFRDVSGNDWPMKGGGPQAASVAAGFERTGDWIEQWRLPIPGSPGRPIAADGKVYFTDGNQLVSVAQTTGTIVFKTALAPDTETNYWRQPAWRNDVFVHRYTYPAKLICIGGLNGASQWESIYAPGDYGSGTGALVTANGVYVNDSSRFLYGKQLSTGGILFSGAIPITDVAGLDLVASNGGLVSVGSGILSVTNPQTGETSWTLNVPNASFSSWGNSTYAISPAVQGAMACYVSQNYALNGAELIAVNLTKRSVLWRVSGPFAGNPALADSLVYLNAGSSLQARSLLTGELVSTFTPDVTTSFAGLSPEVTETLLVAVSSTGVVIFDRKTGAQLQRLTPPVGSPNFTSVCLAGNRCFATASYPVRLLCYGTSPPPPPPAMAAFAAPTPIEPTPAPVAAPEIFRITQITRTSDNQLHITWPSVSGQSYVVECSTDLVSWQAITESLPGMDGEQEHTLPIEGERCFLRVRLVDP